MGVDCLVGRLIGQTWIASARTRISLNTTLDRPNGRVAKWNQGTILLGQRLLYHLSLTTLPHHLGIHHATHPCIILLLASSLPAPTE